MRATNSLIPGLILCFGLLAAGPALAKPKAEAAPAAQAAVGTIVVRNGQVDIQRSGESAWTKAEKGMLVFEGDRIRTRELSATALLLQDGSLTKLSANSDLSIPVKAKDKRTRVKLLMGRLWAKISKQGSDLEIETPSAVAAIKGTELELSINERGEVVLTVWEGLIRFFNAQGEVLVKASQRSQASSGTKPQDPVTINLGTLEKWFEAPETPATKSIQALVRDSQGQEQKIKLKYQKR